MRLISRSKPGPEPGPSADDDLGTGVTGLLRSRRLVIRVLLVLFLLLPVAALRKYPLNWDHGFLILATLAFVALTDRTVLVRVSEPGRYSRWQWVLLPLMVALGAALFAVGGMAWLTALAVASAGVGRFAPDGRATVIGLVCCTVIAVAIGAATGLSYGNTFVAGAVVALGNLLAHGAERRNVLMYRLKETRAELARAAVAEERLRISRDLHDLLGHSLSLITLKAELAGRVIGTDPQRAAREIAELETVARRSLTEVRQAVTSYRQPSLAAELVSSRRMLASAGIDCRVRVPGAYSLPAAVDTLLAWTVREGATNIVRHAAARHAEIVIEMTGTEASASLSDDGVGPSGACLAGTVTAGADPAGGLAARVVPGTAESSANGSAGRDRVQRSRRGAASPERGRVRLMGSAVWQPTGSPGRGRVRLMGSAVWQPTGSPGRGRVRLMGSAVRQPTGSPERGRVRWWRPRPVRGWPGSPSGPPASVAPCPRAPAARAGSGCGSACR